ncbi:MAG: acyl-CoA thioesterase [Planctomycetota bacterium]
MQPRTVSESVVEMTELVFPNDTNPLGNLMGGRVMHLVDIAAAIAAGRHARRHCVTATIDEIVFLAPVPMGSVLVIKSSVNLACRTSMEVGVRVESEDRVSGARRHCASAYLTFVAVDDSSRPTPVPQLTAVTDEEKRRMRNAEERRERRLDRASRKSR